MTRSRFVAKLATGAALTGFAALGCSSPAPTVSAWPAMRLEAAEPGAEVSA